MENLLNITHHENGILEIRLNRPENLNALSHALLHQLSQAFQNAAQDKKVKALLLTGAGKAFCAGADIKQLAPLNGPDGVAFAKAGQAVFRQLELLGKPSLAAIQGFALGGGCELAMATTLRIATDNAQFSQPEINLGLIPGFGGTQRLSRLVGKGRALELCLTGRRFSALEALQWGFLNKLTSPESLIEEAKTLLLSLTRLSTTAVSCIIAAIQHGYDLPLGESLELEAAYFGLCCSTQNKQEGVSAFLEKRTPVFS